MELDGLLRDAAAAELHEKGVFLRSVRREQPELQGRVDHDPLHAPVRAGVVQFSRKMAELLVCADARGDQILEALVTEAAGDLFLDQRRGLLHEGAIVCPHLLVVQGQEGVVGRAFRHLFRQGVKGIAQSGGQNCRRSRRRGSIKSKQLRKRLQSGSIPAKHIGFRLSPADTAAQLLLGDQFPQAQLGNSLLHLFGRKAEYFREGIHQVLRVQGGFQGAGHLLTLYALIRPAADQLIRQIREKIRTHKALQSMVSLSYCITNSRGYKGPRRVLTKMRRNAILISTIGRRRLWNGIMRN